MMTQLDYWTMQWRCPSEGFMSIKTTAYSTDFADRGKSFLANLNWPHLITILAVYSITGTLALQLSRLILNGALHMDGSFVSGPWAFRGAYILVMPPIYSLMLIAIGTVFGKYHYFRQRVLKMWGRILPISRFVKTS